MYGFQPLRQGAADESSQCARSDPGGERNAEGENPILLGEVGGIACRFVALGSDNETRFAAAVEAILRERRPLPAPLSSFSPTAIAPEYLRLYQRLLDCRKVSKSPETPETARREKGKNMETKPAI